MVALQSLTLQRTPVKCGLNCSCVAVVETSKILMLHHDRRPNFETLGAHITCIRKQKVINMVDNNKE